MLLLRSVLSPLSLLLLAAASSPAKPQSALLKYCLESDKAIAPGQYVQISTPLQQIAGEGPDQTLAPYFYVAGSPENEQLPLKETSARVDIVGVIARIQVRQVFENHGTHPIEAVYVFPASTRAAVHGMRMKIGERTVEAKIDRKDAARQTYQAAQQAGQRASLLEQQRPNVFTMNVANLMPKDRIEVHLDYTELIVPEDSVYEFVYPTSVGPRYGGGVDKAKNGWIANPYLKEGQVEPYRFDIKVHLETGIPLKDLASPSHAVSVSYGSPGSADVGLSGPGGGNKDFVLRYRLAGDRIESGLLLFPGEKEGFFALMVEPPQRPTLKQINAREYIFVLDVSGSMHGFPLNTAKVLMKDLLSQLRPTDTFNVVLFSGASYVMSPQRSLPATEQNIQQAIELIGRQNGGGSTELLAALRNAYGIPKSADGTSRSVVVVTDGYVGVEGETFRYIREHLNEANLFSFGIGSSVNRALIEGMARAGQGEPFTVLNPSSAPGEARKLEKYISQPVLSGIEVRFRGFDAYEVAPTKVPDVMARRPVLMFGKYRGSPSGTIELTGTSGSGRFTKTLSVSAAAASTGNASLRWLWARKWVELLEDQHHLTHAKEVEEAITDLGLAYTLLTPFTSFVAVDSQVVNAGGRSQTVSQPLPLPEGVSNHAVGGQGALAAKSMSARVPRQLAKSDAPAAPEEAEAFSTTFGSATAPSAPASLKMKGVIEPTAVRERKELEDKDEASPPNLVLNVLSPEGGDWSALLREVKQALNNKPDSTRGAAVLTVILDAQGKIQAVKVQSALAAFAKNLEAALKSLVGKKVAHAAATVRMQLRQ